MLPVEIFPVQDSIVLRARGSELLILPHHVRRLKGLTQTRDFSGYFRDEALVNRPARKLFEAWLRKDQTLWPRLYKLVHKELTLSPEDGDPAETSMDAPGPATVDTASKTTAAAETSVPAVAQPPAPSEDDSTTEESPKAKKPARKTAAKKTEGESSTASKGAAAQSTAAKDKTKVAKKTVESKDSKAAPKKATATTKPKGDTASDKASDTAKRTAKGTKKGAKKGTED